jgi:hypothetical protein
MRALHERDRLPSVAPTWNAVRATSDAHAYEVYLAAFLRWADRDSKHVQNERDPSEKQAPIASTPEEPRHEPTRVSEPTPEGSVPLETLRAKLDAAIAAEAWDAVRIIHARIVEAERSAAGNVISIGSAKRTNGSR